MGNTATRVALALSLALGVGGCATTSGDGAGARGASTRTVGDDVCGIGPLECSAGDGMPACFETLETLAWGSKVRVTSRLVGAPEACAAGVYCRCLRVMVAAQDGEAPCLRCERTEFIRTAEGQGRWQSAVIDFNLPVRSVAQLTHGAATGRAATAAR